VFDTKIIFTAFAGEGVRGKTKRQRGDARPLLNDRSVVTGRLVSRDSFGRSNGTDLISRRESARTRAAFRTLVNSKLIVTVSGFIIKRLSVSSFATRKTTVIRPADSAYKLNIHVPAPFVVVCLRVDEIGDVVYTGRPNDRSKSERSTIDSFAAYIDAVHVSYTRVITPIHSNVHSPRARVCARVSTAFPRVGTFSNVAPLASPRHCRLRQ